MLTGITTFKERFGEIRYVMAPMAGITDTVFRLLIREMGAPMVVSDLLSAEGMVRGGDRTLEMMRFDERERPIGIQIFGSNAERLRQAALIVQEEGADFVDINLGCPVKKVVCDGGGAAWLKEPDKLGEMLSHVKSTLRIPLSIKVRTGWDENSRNIHEIVDVAAKSKVEWVAIHGRTRAQGYAGEADWDLIRDVARKATIPVIGNGDLVSAALARKRVEEGYSHAVMIGRGALKNPWIFQEAITGEILERDFLALINRHFDIACEKRDRYKAFLSLKKFLSWYAAGFPYCSQFRQSLFQTEDVDQLRALALEYFSTLNWNAKVDDNQPFLMGGHG